MFTLTTITTVYLVVAAGLLALAAWGYAGYQKSPSPLTKYLSLSTLFAAMYFMFNSVPFILTNNLDVLKMAVNIGDVFYYSAVLVMPFMIWYLLFNKRPSPYFLFVPTFIITIGVYVTYVYNIWHTQVALKAGFLDYSWPIAALRFDALLGALFVISGLLLLRLTKTATSFRGRIRIITIAAAYLVGGANAIYNTLFLRGLNNSLVIDISYVAIFAIVLVVSLVGGVHKARK